MPTDEFVTPSHVAEARDALRDKGCLLIEKAFSREWCAGVTSWIDAHSGAGRTERQYDDTELRIWDAQEQTPVLHDFWRQCNAFMSKLVGRSVQSHTLLAIRNRPIDPTAKNLRVGRWHIDSFMRQYKIFLFLVDVTESTGPFEFLPRSQHTWFKVRTALTGPYFRPMSLFGSQRAYSQLDDDWVHGLSRQGHVPTPVLCPSGTVMIVDTSAIHRASPCFGETRYALTAYF